MVRGRPAANAVSAGDNGGGTGGLREVRVADALTVDDESVIGRGGGEGVESSDHLVDALDQGAGDRAGHEGVVVPGGLGLLQGEIQVGRVLSDPVIGDPLGGSIESLIGVIRLAVKGDVGVEAAQLLPEGVEGFAEKERLDTGSMRRHDTKSSSLRGTRHAHLM